MLLQFMNKGAVLQQNMAKLWISRTEKVQYGRYRVTIQPFVSKMFCCDFYPWHGQIGLFAKSESFLRPVATTSFWYLQRVDINVYIHQLTFWLQAEEVVWRLDSYKAPDESNDARHVLFDAFA